MGEQLTGFFQEYIWWSIIPGILIVLGLGVRAHFKYMEMRRADAMLHEVDNYNSQEAVGDMPYNNERP